MAIVRSDTDQHADIAVVAFESVGADEVCQQALAVFGLIEGNGNAAEVETLGIVQQIGIEGLRRVDFGKGAEQVLFFLRGNASAKGKIGEREQADADGGKAAEAEHGAAGVGIWG